MFCVWLSHEAAVEAVLKILTLLNNTDGVTIYLDLARKAEFNFRDEVQIPNASWSKISLLNGLSKG